MKKPLFLLMFLFCVSVPAFAEGARQLLDQVVAIVNDDPITQSELDMILRPVYEDYKSQYTGEALMSALTDAKRKVLNQLIEDKLVYQEAKNQKIEPDVQEVEEMLADFKKKFKSDDELEDTLSKEGMSLSALRDRLERQSVIRSLQEREVRAKVVVSPLEVEQFYQEHADQFASEGTVRVRSLTIKKSEEARAKGLTDEGAKKKIDNLKLRVEKGEDFNTLAQQHSEDTAAKNGGLTNWIKPGEMIPEINQVIFSLKPGQVSNVIETPMGYHIFRVEEKREKFQKSLEEARPLIYQKIFQEKSMKRFQEWMESLKRTAYISIR